MEQVISTALTKNEIMQLSGPGAVKIVASKSVVISTVKTGAIITSAAAAGTLSSAIAPIVGLAVLLGGLVTMVKIGEKYGTSKK
ncbi:MAG: hypothetical protein HQL70_02575 [Magnetococcales bacterium]|nr:hypothetical protein [Magnetococcales bacterium]